MKRFASALLGLLCACGLPQPEIQPLQTFAPVAVTEVLVFAGPQYVVGKPDTVAVIGVADADRWLSSAEQFDAVRARVGQMGANTIIVDRTPIGRMRHHLVAVRVPRLASTHAAAQPPASGSGSSTGSSVAGGSSGGSVQVRGYRRRDGTYVRPHTRSRPGSRSGGRRH